MCLERLIKDHMVDFLVRHKLLNPTQHGFLKARSCLANMFFFKKSKVARRGITRRYHILRFQKAFDKVPLQRLLLKLKAHSIRDGIIDWIEQWLTDRRQHVVVDGEVFIVYKLGDHIVRKIYSLLNSIAKRDLAKLQRVQNCLARVVLRAPRFSPSLPLLKLLHWLPVSY